MEDFHTQRFITSPNAPHTPKPEEDDFLSTFVYNAFHTKRTREEVAEEILSYSKMRVSDTDYLTSFCDQILCVDSDYDCEDQPMLADGTVVIPPSEAPEAGKESPAFTACKDVDSAMINTETVSRTMPAQILGHGVSNTLSPVLQRADPDTPPLGSKLHPDEHPITLHVLHILNLRFGFIPLSRSTSFLHLTAKRQELSGYLKIILELSFSRDVSPVFSSSYSESILKFLEPAGRKKLDSSFGDGKWDVIGPKWVDIEKKSEDEQVKMERLNAVRPIVPSKMWAFDFKSQEGKEEDAPPWLLGLMTPTNVLSVCRLSPSLENSKLPVELIRLGVTFRLFPRSSLKLQKDLFDFDDPSRTERKGLPMVAKGILLTRQDYDAYVARRQEMLRNPRIRALALREGGILWRFAISSNDKREIEELGMQYWSCNEELSCEEVRMLCGTYSTDDETPSEDPTSELSYYREKSWWPLPHTWRHLGNVTFEWSERHEEIFVARLRALEGLHVGGMDSTASPQHYPQPMFVKEWLTQILDYRSPWAKKVDRELSGRTRLAAQFLSAATGEVSKAKRKRECHSTRRNGRAKKDDVPVKDTTFFADVWQAAVG